MKCFSIIAACILTAWTNVYAQKQWTLGECIEYAVEHNIRIQIQKDAVKQQEISLSTSRNRRLPNLYANVSADIYFSRSLSLDNTYVNNSTANTSFTIGTSVPLITGGRIPAEMAKSRIDLQASLADLERARQDVGINVTTAYLTVLCDKELVEAAYHQLELSNVQKHRIEILVQNGKATESELADIMSTVANDELAYTQQCNACSLSLLNLSQLLELTTLEGFDVASMDVSGMTHETLINPEVAYSEAVVSKPQILAEELRIKSADRNILITKSDLYPTLDFNAGLGSHYYNTLGTGSPSFGIQMRDHFSPYLGLSLYVPIFNRLATRNSVRSARVQLHTQQLELDEAKKTLYHEIQQAYYNAVAAQKECQSSDAAFHASEVAFKQMEKKFEIGKANSTEYQESKTKLVNAQSDYIRSCYQFVFLKKILDFYSGQSLY